ncbi:MAG: hypothetical protein AAGF11_22330 [Myxococcota bacterium]
MTACAAPCIDDGLIQDQCPSPGDGDAAATDSAATDSADSADSLGDDTAGTGGGSGSMTTPVSDSHGEGDAGSGALGDDSSGGTESLWCEDTDGDGFGDPDKCQTAVGPIEGSVTNDGDCDDSEPHTFPGAAPNDDPEACMRDADGDDWGDDQPGDGVEPGTDCDDDNQFAFPGAAEHEDPSNLCTLDADGDGWGDVNPGEGVVGGHDCYDGNAALNPDKLRLTTFLPSGGDPMGLRTLATVNPLSAAVTSVVAIQDPGGSNPDVDISTATVDEFGHVYTNDLNSVTIHKVDYAGACMSGTGELEPLMNTYGVPGDIVCGLEFGGNGMLYGIDNDDNLMTFDTTTGAVTSVVPIETMGIPLNINSCGMAYDCVEDRLLVANGINHTIYSIDPATGVAQELRDLGNYFNQNAPWDPVGLEYDLMTKRVYISTGQTLYYVDLDVDDDEGVNDANIDEVAGAVFVNNFGQEVSNLQYLPICL